MARPMSRTRSSRSLDSMSSADRTRHRSPASSVGRSSRRPHAPEREHLLTALPGDMASLALDIRELIDRCLSAPTKDVLQRCRYFQDLLKLGIEKNPRLMDEIHRQLLAWLRGGKRQHSMLSCWELMLLAVHAAPPKLETAEAVANTAAVVARARSYPAIASLAAMTHRLLAQPSPSVQRQRVPSLKEMVAVLTGSPLQVQVYMTDNSIVLLLYHVAMTVEAAAENLAHQAGMKEPSAYCLFEARKMEKSGAIVLLPLKALLGNRLVVDVLKELETEGGRHRLLLRRRNLDADDDSLTPAQLICMLEAQQELIEERGRALAEMRNRLDSEGGQRQRVHAQYDKTLGLLKLLQKELLASEDEREAAEKGLKELRQMAVRHNREEKRSKEAMQQLWTENDELHAKLQNAQRAAEAAAREAAAKRRPPGPGLASLLASIQSTEHDIEAEIVKLAQGSASVDAAVKEALQEKLEEYLESGRNGRRPPNSVDSRSLAGKLLQLSRNPGSQSVQDLQRLARLSIETLRQLELQLEFANAAQKGLADMYITECEASKRKTEQLEATRDEAATLRTELSAKDAKLNAMTASRDPEVVAAGNPGIRNQLDAAMSRLKGAPAAAVYDTEMDLALAASNLAQSSGDVDQIQGELQRLLKGSTRARDARTATGDSDEAGPSFVSKVDIAELLREQATAEGMATPQSEDSPVKAAELQRLRARLTGSYSKDLEDMSEDGSPFSELAARKRGLESEESAGLSSEARGRRRLTNSSRASVESQQLLKRKEEDLARLEAELKAKLERSAVEAAQMRTESKLKEASLARAKQQIQDLEAQVVSKQEEAEAAWRELAEAKETVAVQAKQLSQAEALASRSEEAKRRERRQEVQLLEAREQLTQQETKAQQAESALQALRGEHAAAVDRHRRAQIQANQRIFDLEREVAALRRELSARESELLALTQSILEITQERDAAAEEVQALSEKLRSSQSTASPTRRGSARVASSLSWNPVKLDWIREEEEEGEPLPAPAVVKTDSTLVVAEKTAATADRPQLAPKKAGLHTTAPRPKPQPPPQRTTSEPIKGTAETTGTKAEAAASAAEASKPSEAAETLAASKPSQTKAAPLEAGRKPSRLPAPPQSYEGQHPNSNKPNFGETIRNVITRNFGSSKAEGIKPSYRVRPASQIPMPAALAPNRPSMAPPSLPPELPSRALQPPPQQSVSFSPFAMKQSPFSRRHTATVTAPAAAPATAPKAAKAGATSKARLLKTGPVFSSGDRGAWLLNQGTTSRLPASVKRTGGGQASPSTLQAEQPEPPQTAASKAPDSHPISASTSRASSGSSLADAPKGGASVATEVLETMPSDLLLDTAASDLVAGAASLAAGGRSPTKSPAIPEPILSTSNSNSSDASTFLVKPRAVGRSAPLSRQSSRSSASQPAAISEAKPVAGNPGALFGFVPSVKPPPVTPGKWKPSPPPWAVGEEEEEAEPLPLRTSASASTQPSQSTQPEESKPLPSQALDRNVWTHANALFAATPAVASAPDSTPASVPSSRFGAYKAVSPAARGPRTTAFQRLDRAAVSSAAEQSQSSAAEVDRPRGTQEKQQLSAAGSSSREAPAAEKARAAALEQIVTGRRAAVPEPEVRWNLGLEQSARALRKANGLDSDADSDHGSVFSTDSLDEVFNLGVEFQELIRAALRAESAAIALGSEVHRQKKSAAPTLSRAFSE